MVKEHIQSILAGLFNIILHLQNPLIFQRFMHDKGNANPDSGSVILMCIEVLIRIFGKHALFQMKPWHVAQSLRIPAALFQDFHQIKLSEASISSHSSLILDNEISDQLASKDLSVVDRHFSIDLFAACCRLLYTVLKHHKRYSLSFFSFLFLVCAFFRGVGKCPQKHGYNGSYCRVLKPLEPLVQVACLQFFCVEDNMTMLMFKATVSAHLLAQNSAVV